MARTWIIDGRGIARKVKNANLPSANQIIDCGATRECPNCHYHIGNSDASYDWPGFPAGVKFDPSDVELLENLAAKCGIGGVKPHVFIDEFIQTVEDDDGICYTHPEKLPGAKKDGSSIYFFHRIRNAYSSGQRKRRRINNQDSMNSCVRWHKTGKTKSVSENGVMKGCKKIMVLYGTQNGGSKPEKCNWIMHQYHLGTVEEEREGEYVVSKIFYQQPKETTRNEIGEQSDTVTVQVIPRTPKTIAPDPPRLEKTPSSDCGSDDYPVPPSLQEGKDLKGLSHTPYGNQLEDEMEYATSLGGDSEDALNGVNSLFCNEILNSFGSACERGDEICGLDNIELDTPPDFQLSDLQFGSQDSVFDWLDRL